MEKEFERERREYCAGCYTSLNCPVGQNQFKTCTHKAFMKLGVLVKQPTYAEEQASIDSDKLRSEGKP